MECKVIQTDKAPSAIGPYSQGIGAGSFVFVSGQIGINPETGEMVTSDFAAQTRQVLENMKQILLAAGCGLNNVVSADVFLTDMGNFVEFNGIYEEYFSDHRPARAVIQVSALPKGAVVEVKCIANSAVNI
ncbi:MAG: RidA family protein [Desulfobacteraceae bacterium]|nr:RidA family protein [Desulfobacteraceae bacterium]